MARHGWPLPGGRAPHDIIASYNAHSIGRHQTGRVFPRPVNAHHRPEGYNFTFPPGTFYWAETLRKFVRRADDSDE